MKNTKLMWLPFIILFLSYEPSGQGVVRADIPKVNKQMLPMTDSPKVEAALLDSFIMIKDSAFVLKEETKTEVKKLDKTTKELSQQINTIFKIAKQN